MELQPPKKDEQIKLIQFIAERDLTDDEVSALDIKGADDLSIAHLQEVVIRAELDDKSFREVIQELVDHAQKFKRGFTKERASMGFGFGNDDDD
jgi:hypothetical protein